MKKKQKRSIKLIVLNKGIRLGGIVLIILLISAIVFLFFSTQKRKYIEQKIPQYTYNNKANVQYKVYMIPNMLYTQNNLGEGEVYINDFIDNISTLFTYQFDGDSPAEINGEYSIIAVVEGLLGNEKGNKTIWSKEYVMQPETSFSGNDKSFSIQKDIPIKLAQYNSFVQQIMESTKINFENKLTIYWKVSVEAKTDKGEIKEQLTPTMEIPLNNKYFEIGGNLEPEKKGVIEENIKVIAPAYQNKITMCYIGIGICLFGLLFILLFTVSATITDPLEKQLKRIFKLHGDRMVALNDEVEISSNKTIQVSSIEDLVRISDDIGKPILYNKEVNSESNRRFYVVDEKLIYMLSLISDSTKTILINKNSTEVIPKDV